MLRLAAGQCGWAHAVSHDLAHWKNLRYPLIPGSKPTDPDAKGCWDGSLTLSPSVNGGRPLILYGTPGNQYNVARPADLDDAELTYWTKDAANPVAFVNGTGPSWQPGQVWRNSLGSRIWGQKMGSGGSRLAESERGVGFG